VILTVPVFPSTYGCAATLPYVGWGSEISAVLETGDSCSGKRRRADGSKIAEAIWAVAEAAQAKMQEGAAPADLRALSTDFVRVNEMGEIQVYVLLSAYLPEHVAQLVAVGLRVEVTLPEFRLVQGWVPASAIDFVAGFDFVVAVKPPGYPIRSHGGPR
jgi:hypothetical protein